MDLDEAPAMAGEKGQHMIGSADVEQKEQKPSADSLLSPCYIWRRHTLLCKGMGQGLGDSCKGRSSRSMEVGGQLQADGSTESIADPMIAGDASAVGRRPRAVDRPGLNLPGRTLAWQPQQQQQQQQQELSKAQCLVRSSVHVIGPGAALEGSAIYKLSEPEAAAIRWGILQRKSVAGGGPAVAEDSLAAAGKCSRQERAKQLMQAALASAAKRKMQLIGYVASPAPRGLVRKPCPSWFGRNGLAYLQLACAETSWKERCKTLCTINVNMIRK
jgi:hypothetical protein